ncbi:excinuclease ABC subunit UvrA [Nitrococcus mobilis]|uniref:UvrABC system protein A n=1 Tax=Nitrococcus mobilis Nb-231 TaxID=314278 RepID=A4BT19_9GAMM|nr:excinuclease ABC subunit UvrA [Nitrococcus mobilis]EAR21087.1 excinuclease ABC, A subunit [Nitrococcus mobilis Nb-231]
MDTIRIQGARTHNLCSIDLELPRDRLTVITGISGSGKSSLAFDTIFAEGQRRYVESLSAYARQFLSLMQKPDVDHIEGLSPAISIEQKASSHNPRSTVGTVTEIYDYLRLLYARAGTPCCPEHGIELNAQTVSQMVDQILSLPEGTKLMLLAPRVEGRKGEHYAVMEELRRIGFIRARIDGEVMELDELPRLNAKHVHTIEAVVDRFRVRPDQAARIADSVETCLELTGGNARLSLLEAGSADDELIFSACFACPQCGYSLAELEPRLFSFNNPQGACALCSGLGQQQFFDPERLVQHPELSLPGGAVRGWDRRNVYYSQLLSDLADHYSFGLETPFGALPQRIRDILLYGSGDECIEFRYRTPQGRHKVNRHSFEGIIPNIQRRYRETDSSVVREELAHYLTLRVCPDCHGTRLNRGARHVFIAGQSLPGLAECSIGQALAFFEQLALPGSKGAIAEPISKEIQKRLSFLVNVGLEYLTLARSANTLSAGESQRIRLASQIGAGLVGVMYVLDEPSIGLHQRDNERLLQTLLELRDLGNTLIVVEHDEDAIRTADHIVDIGPGAGTHGGRVVAQGRIADIERSLESITGDYLCGRRRIEVPIRRKPVEPSRTVRLRNARGNNLRGIDVQIPAGVMICVTGVSGSGKSTLINDTLYRYAARELNGASETPAPCDGVDNLELFDKVTDIDQSPIGRTPRSNPATYTGVLAPLRALFAGTAEARSRGYRPGRFSFNIKGGRCEACQGDGMLRVEMHFLPDIYVPCDICKGRRYNRETLEIKYKGRNIYETLQLTVADALDCFGAVPVIKRKLQTLVDVGLGYIKLGQSATTLSGGEAQRVKLARELSKRDTGKTLYILDEPTTGLHFHDINQLLQILQRLRDHGNTVIVIEHNLDVIKTADWIIDLGPEGGTGGGQIVATGTPEDIANAAQSHTGRFLKPLLAAQLLRCGQAKPAARQHDSRDSASPV